MSAIAVMTKSPVVPLARYAGRWPRSPMKPLPMSAPRNVFAMLGSENIFAAILVKRLPHSRAEGGNVRQDHLGSLPQESDDTGSLRLLHLRAAPHRRERRLVHARPAGQLLGAAFEEAFEIVQFVCVAEDGAETNQPRGAVSRQSRGKSVEIGFEPGVDA